MLEFEFIADEQLKHAKDLNRAGGIEWEEFEEAQKLGLIENRYDYYVDFRWSGQQVQQKHAALTPVIEVAIPKLASILKQAFAANCGLVTFGD